MENQPKHGITDLAIGDILILRKEAYPGARSYNDEDADYICVLTDFDRPYASVCAWRIGNKKLFYDPEWNRIDFYDEDIVIRLNDATKKYKEYLDKQQEVKPTLVELYSNLTDKAVAEKKAKYDLNDLHDNWILSFFQQEWKTYQDLFNNHLE